MMTQPSDDKPLAGRLAVITGASRGIGAATAQALAAAGAHVVLVARTIPDLEKVEQAIHEAGGSATLAPLDLTDGTSIGRLATAVLERWGKLDILMLNAAMLGTLAAVPAIDLKEFARQMTLNIAVTQAMIAAFDPLLRASDEARVIAMTSTVAGNPRAYWGAYGATKAAMDVLVSAYGQEVAKVSNVRTHIVNPGATRTAMRARAYPGEDPATVKSPDVVAVAIREIILADTPDGARIALPDA
jgi:NAD(P)-dependent dehydrogenase (short-subunit alcohol dehydrogenase family)